MIRFSDIAILLLVLLLPGAASVSLAQATPAAPAIPAETQPRRQLLVITGADGTAEFGEMFRQWRENWVTAASDAGFITTVIDGSDPLTGSLPRLESYLESVADTATDSPDELWLVLIGHGTFDGQRARFNLVGPDVSASQLATWLEPREARTVIINCSSASAPFAGELAGRNRIVVTATKSGYEMSFSRFGGYLAEAIASADVDLDKDQQTSLLEAVIHAGGRTAEFYAADSRLATEHALIEDNGDGLGTPVEWFRGIRVRQAAKDDTPADGLRTNQVFFRPSPPTRVLSAGQQKKRDGLEGQLEVLRGQKSHLTEDQYYRKLEALMTELARLYESPAEDPASGE